MSRKLILEVLGVPEWEVGDAWRKEFGAAGGRIGRAFDCDWVLSNRYMSRHHATVSCLDGVFYIEAIGENGVAVNEPDEKLPKHERRVLEDGDHLFLDEYEISVAISEGVEGERAAEAVPLINEVELSLPVTVRQGNSPEPLSLVAENATVPKKGWDSKPAVDLPSEPSSTPVSRPPRPASVAKPEATLPSAGDARPSRVPKVAFSSGSAAAPLPGGTSRPAPVPAAGASAKPALVPMSGANSKPAPAPIQATNSDTALMTMASVSSLPTVLPIAESSSKPASATTSAATAKPSLGPMSAASSRATATVLAMPIAEPTTVPLARPVSSVMPGTANGFDVAAFLSGAGLDPQSVPPEMAATLGQIVRAVVQGLMDVLRARAEFRSQFRLVSTRVQISQNNPLKFSIDAEDALSALLRARSPGYLSPLEALEDAFDDIRFHQVAMLAGMRAGFESVTQRFNPEKVMEQSDRRRQGSLSRLGAKGRYWDRYVDLFEEVAAYPDAGFQRLYGEEFSDAYERQLEDLKRNRARAST